MDTVGCDDHIGFRRSSVAERTSRLFAGLLEWGATMAGVQCTFGKRIGQHLHEVGAVHSKRRVPAGGVRYLDRRDGRSVVAKITRIRSDPRSPFFHLRFK